MSTWVVGSLNVDLVVRTERLPDEGETVHGSAFDTFLGGKGGNQAMALSRLGAAPRVVGCVGDDAFGSRYRNTLLDTGADTSAIATAAGVATGTALIEVDAEGHNRIVVVAGANAEVTPDAVATSLTSVAEGDLVLLQLEIPIETVIATATACSRRGASVILDPAPASPVSKELLAAIAWITPNEHEAAVLTGIDTSSDEGIERAARELLALGVDNVVVKAGSRGAVYAHGGTIERIAGFPVEVVDTTAAGDSFNGGLAWALARGLGGVEAVRCANAVAALSVTGMGAQTAMPTAEEVDRFLAARE